MKRLSYLFILVSALLMTLVTAASAAPLPAEEAFKLSVFFVRPQVVMAEWQIAPGYYLYVKRTKVNFTPNNNISVNMPQGEFKQDEEHGRYEVYSGTVTLPVELSNGQVPTTVSIDYQGCAQDGFCYPPMTKTFMLNVAASQATEISDVDVSVKAAPTLRSLLTDQNDIDALLQDQSLVVLLLIFVGLGLLLAFTPCVLPMVPILTSIIVGQKHAPRSKQAFFLSLAYVLGMSITYALAGVAVASLGSSMQVWLQKPVTIIIVSMMFMLLALSLFGLYELRISRNWHNKIYAWSNKHEGGTYLGVFFMGVLSTLVVSPCVTAPLVGVLIYIAQTGNAWLGASALFALGIGMGIPLLLIGMSAGRWLPKSGPWMKAVKELFGIFMLAMAIWLLSRILSHATTYILFGILLLGTAGFVGLYLPRLVGLRSINHGVGCVSALLGLMLIFNGINIQLTAKNTALQTTSGVFTVVNNMNDLEKYLVMAQEANQPVLLDFYADWCASCVQMDKKVFDRQDVQAALAHFMLLRADLSKNSRADTEILSRYQVIAPPTVIFFNNSGMEVNSRRIVGELNENEFLSRIQSFVTASCDTKIQC